MNRDCSSTTGRSISSPPWVCPSILFVLYLRCFAIWHTCSANSAKSLICPSKMADSGTANIKVNLTQACEQIVLPAQVKAPRVHPVHHGTAEVHCKEFIQTPVNHWGDGSGGQVWHGSRVFQSKSISICDEVKSIVLKRKKDIFFASFHLTTKPPKGNILGSWGTRPGCRRSHPQWSLTCFPLSWPLAKIWSSRMSADLWCRSSRSWPDRRSMNTLILFAL